MRKTLILRLTVKGYIYIIRNKKATNLLEELGKRQDKCVPVVKSLQ